MPRYEISYPNDPMHAAIVVVQDESSWPSFASYRDGTAEEVLDVALYGEAEGRGHDLRWYEESVASLEALVVLANRGLAALATIERLKAGLRFDQAACEEITKTYLDVDSDEAYSIEQDTRESYHAGRVEALTNAIDLLLGREVTLYAETEGAEA